MKLRYRPSEVDAKGKPLGISSVVWPGTKGFIYVEANKESHAEDTVKNIRMCMSWSIKLVPINEMTAVLTVVNNKKALELTFEMINADKQDSSDSAIVFAKGGTFVYLAHLLFLIVQNKEQQRSSAS